MSKIGLARAPDFCKSRSPLICSRASCARSWIPEQDTVISILVEHVHLVGYGAALLRQTRIDNISDTSYALRHSNAFSAAWYLCLVFCARRAQKTRHKRG